MEQRYLYHYYEARKGPFKNFSSLPLDEAQALMSTLIEDNAVFASKRSADYLQIRMELEAKAQNLFNAGRRNGTRMVVKAPNDILKCKYGMKT
ncbi:hypothetical protein [Paenibacillus guangzhouensis]|uniref:hypothetical protein n=1 Tax=Paenibacillus guangzhouensis TaxID=1473112 RepID=UPI001D103CE0|nr:hypothetical protein [Paenibacillus guangzhouensis]